MNPAKMYVQDCAMAWAEELLLIRYDQRITNSGVEQIAKFWSGIRCGRREGMPGALVCEVRVLRPIIVRYGEPR